LPQSGYWHVLGPAISATGAFGLVVGGIYFESCSDQPTNGVSVILDMQCFLEGLHLRPDGGR
jgi:hypothetical protein